MLNVDSCPSTGTGALPRSSCALIPVWKEQSSWKSATVTVDQLKEICKFNQQIQPRKVSSTTNSTVFRMNSTKKTSRKVSSTATTQSATVSPITPGMAKSLEFLCILDMYVSMAFATRWYMKTRCACVYIYIHYTYMMCVNVYIYIYIYIHTCMCVVGDLYCPLWHAALVAAVNHQF